VNKVRKLFTSLLILVVGIAVILPPCSGSSSGKALKLELWDPKQEARLS